MGKYTCEKCGRDFQQKSHSLRHATKKIPCIQDDKLHEIIEEKVKNAIQTKEDGTQKKKLGQYFTIHDELQQFVYDKVLYKGKPLLEPSFGAGHLLKKFKESDNNYPMVCYEIDPAVKPVIPFNEGQTVVYGDFTKQTITRKFQTIIGNPPYVKQSTGNLYIKFIELCYNLLTDDGELIFIVPSDFIKLTSASSLIAEMVQYGSFTDFLFPHNEKLFEGASIDVLVFRYEKGLLTNDTTVNGKTMLCNVNHGILTFSQQEIVGTLVSELFHVYVGIVSGRDAIYKAPFGNMNVLNDKDRVEQYIFCASFPTQNETIDAHLKAHKKELLERKIRTFNETNWFEWGAPRNMKSMEANMNKPCIYVRNMTRNSEVAFVSHVQYFGGSLLCLLPKTDMSQGQLEKVVAHLNSADLRKDYLYSGRFKIGHKQVCNIVLPT